MNKEEAENLLTEVCDKTKVSPWDVYRDWATISPDELLAFANICEKIGMEKAAKICDNEKVDYASTGDLGDLAYNTAIDHVIASIRSAT